MEDYISRMDTERFGFKVARVDEFNGFPGGLMDHLKHQGVRMVISRVNSKDIQTINTLEELGFQVKDIGLMYGAPMEKLDFSSFLVSPEISIREVADRDISEVACVSEESFRDYYGHYFADRRLDRDKCLEIYVDWARRSCKDKKAADTVFVAETDSTVIGFLGFMACERDDRKYLGSTVGGVLPEFRHLGAFQAILQAGHDWARKQGIDYVQYQVLLTNTPINRLLAKVGFRIVDSYVTLHGWFD